MATYPTDANPDQLDTDHDDVGNACDVNNKPDHTEYQIEATMRIKVPNLSMEKIAIGVKFFFYACLRPHLLQYTAVFGSSSLQNGHCIVSLSGMVGDCLQPGQRIANILTFIPQRWQ
jgi:hypothetical protein